jgi:hypothetical protein
LDFNPTEEDIVISRVLVSVHKAIDKKFPHATPAPSRFAKTNFGSDEVTLNEQNPTSQTTEDFTDNFEDSSIKKLESLTNGDNDRVIKHVIIAITVICLIASSIYYLLLSP